MGIKREWATPLAAGAFLLSAVTGVLVFFHADTGLNKVAHEWLSWVLLAAVAVHVIANLQGFKRHLVSRLAQAGLQPRSDQQSLAELAGPYVRKQVRVMAKVFAPAK